MKMLLKAIVSSVFICACSTSTPDSISSSSKSLSDPGADSGSGAPGEGCVFPNFEAPDSTCPSGCNSVSGAKVDAERQCVVAQAPLGCVTCPNGCGG